MPSDDSGERSSRTELPEHPVQQHSRGPAHHEPHLLAAASSPRDSPKPQLLCREVGGDRGPTAPRVGSKHLIRHGATLRSFTMGTVVAQPPYGHTSPVPAPVFLQGSRAPSLAPDRELTAVMEGFFPSPAGG